MTMCTIKSTTIPYIIIIIIKYIYIVQDREEAANALKCDSALPCKMNIGQRCWHDFVIKDVTVKQFTLNVTDIDKISIVTGCTSNVPL